MSASVLGTSSAPATPWSGAGRDQRARARRRGAQHRSHPEPDDAGGEDPPAAEEVAERAADEQQRAEREQIRVDDPLLGGEAAVQVGADRREGDVDERAVQEDRARAEDARQQGQLLAPCGARRTGRRGGRRPALVTAVGSHARTVRARRQRCQPQPCARCRAAGRSSAARLPLAGSAAAPRRGSPKAVLDGARARRSGRPVRVSRAPRRAPGPATIVAMRPPAAAPRAAARIGGPLVVGDDQEAGGPQLAEERRARCGRGSGRRPRPTQSWVSSQRFGVIQTKAAGSPRAGRAPARRSPPGHGSGSALRATSS